MRRSVSTVVSAARFALVGARRWKIAALIHARGGTDEPSRLTASYTRTRGDKCCAYCALGIYR